MVLRLFASESFTEPRLAAKARELIVGYLSKPGFLTGYIAQTAKSGEEGTDADTAVAELMQMLALAGINKETGLKSIAA